jgi:hypothetical protein
MTTASTREFWKGHTQITALFKLPEEKESQKQWKNKNLVPLFVPIETKADSTSRHEVYSLLCFSKYHVLV